MSISILNNNHCLFFFLCFFIAACNETSSNQGVRPPSSPGENHPCSICKISDTESISGMQNQHMGSTAQSLSQAIKSPWIALSNRQSLDIEKIHFTDQFEREWQFENLVDRPVAMSFIYTRCQNTLKCPRVTKMMGLLQEEIHKTGFDDKCRIVLVTFDPLYDNSERLQAFAESLGVNSREGILFVRPNPDTLKLLMDRLGVPIAFEEGGYPNYHGNYAVILDKQGCIARTYSVTIWKNADLVSDLSRLIRE